ncbi:GNAT family N-acetyltransferase [Micromonospora sp. BQ11]|uniref:GNAT family N-acetyltransferase n=1 Tax=Micromonospora sp. BQ11 TaxID=3452212 RepID=UPI003F8A12FC
MIIAADALEGRDAILAATGHHPYARFALWHDDQPRGWRRGDAVGWLLPDGQGPAGAVIGAPEPAVDLVADLVADGALGPDRWLHLPHLDPALLAGRIAVDLHHEWDFLWATAAPPHQPEEERVVRLTDADHPALTALIDSSFPSTTSRPDDPRIVDWYGIRDGDRLVACGADRSRGDIGFVAGLTVAPDRRGRGLGAALTAGMTRALSARHDTVALGVYTDNVDAIRLYRRLGYTGTLGRTSVHLT